MTRYIDADALKASFPITANTTLSSVELFNAAVNAAPTVISITAPPGTVPVTTAPSYRSSKAVVFNAPYSDAKNWTVGKTSAYPAVASTRAYQTNPGDSKLDAIYPNNTNSLPTNAGVFTAIKAAGLWITDLVTTENSPIGFRVKTGDVVAFDFQSDSILGTWPGVWTWNGPGAELDFLEYHGDNPTTAELTNHVNSKSQADYPKVLTPNKLSHFEVVCGATSVDWYIDSNLVYQDKVGVGVSWSAYLIVNLSVAAGNQYHPGPDATTTKIQATIANVTVYR